MISILFKILICASFILFICWLGVIALMVVLRKEIKTDQNFELKLQKAVKLLLRLTVFTYVLEIAIALGVFFYYRLN